MRTFETKIQELKTAVLTEVARLTWEDRLQTGTAILDIPEKIIPGPTATLRCCIYKERAIINSRVKLAMGGDKSNPCLVEVLPIACDECPVTEITVGPSCRGCLATRCVHACPKDAITIVNHRACIDHEKCISCGACVYQCPFGAIVDKSFILDAVNLIKGSHENQDYKVYAVVAPSISSQFSYAKLGQVITGIQRLGFYHVIEAALGADMVAYKEAAELAEKGFLTSSCCPAFVSYIKKNFPTMVDKISHNLSPAAEISRYIKETTPGAKVVFIGPCTAKKMEFKEGEPASRYIDCTLTFEELQALFDSRNIDLTTLEEGVLDNASYYGRIFARSGGLSDAVVEALKEQNNEDFKLNAIACDGIEACKAALLRASKNVLPNNFIEGMACTGGCIGGAGCLTHGEKNKADVDKYGKQAMEKTILDAISVTDVGPEAE